MTRRLVPAPGVTWLCPEGLSLFPTPLKVPISFWGRFGQRLQASKSNTYLQKSMNCVPAGDSERLEQGTPRCGEGSAPQKP